MEICLGEDNSVARSAGRKQQKCPSWLQASNLPGSEKEEIVMKVLVVYYSMYGHVYKMAEAVETCSCLHRG